MEPHDTAHGGVLDDLARSFHSSEQREVSDRDAWSAEGDVLRDLLGGY